MADKISTTDLKSKKSDFVIIDVREVDELDGGVIEDSISMPLGLVYEMQRKNRLKILKVKFMSYGLS